MMNSNFIYPEKYPVTNFAIKLSLIDSNRTYAFISDWFRVYCFANKHGSMLNSIYLNTYTHIGNYNEII